MKPFVETLSDHLNERGCAREAVLINKKNDISRNIGTKNELQILYFKPSCTIAQGKKIMLLVVKTVLLVDE